MRLLGRSFHRLRRLFAASLLALLCVGSVAQEVTPESGKVTLLYAILANTTWPDENSIDKFVIGLHGRDRALWKELKRQAPKLQVRGKDVVAVQFDKIDKARAAHVLVLTRSKNSRLAEINQALSGSHTLVVTEESSDQRNVMINFVFPPGPACPSRSIAAISFTRG